MKSKLQHGTPTTLYDAIKNGLHDDAAGGQGGYPDIIKAHVRDYLSRSFSVAMNKAETNAESDRLMTLFKRLVNE